MGFWDSVNEELKKAVGEGWTAVKDNAKIGKLRLKVNSLHKKAGRHFSEIGGKVYDMSKQVGEVKPNPLESPGVIRLIEEINAVEEEVRGLEAEIAKIRRKEAAAKGGPSEKAEEPGEGKGIGEGG
ncbi:MAG: hypothetical protein Q8P48_00540 [Deltaproteobacteria bacterium]|nr:hypothetical protein [Deltaproteobacteria bacterium]